MAKFENKSGSTLVLPDDTVILAGSTADVPDVKNVAVGQWVDAGWLVPVAHEPVAKRTEKK